METVSESPRLYSCSTAELLVIAAEATKLDYNRQLSDDALDSLDPDGVHVIQPFMIHEHANGVAVDPHMRCRLFLKFEELTGAQEAWLDIPFDHLPSNDGAIVP